MELLERRSFSKYGRSPGSLSTVSVVKGLMKLNIRCNRRPNLRNANRTANTGLEAFLVGEGGRR